MTTRSVIFGGGVKKLPKVRHGVQDTLVGSAPPGLFTFSALFCGGFFVGTD